MLPATTALVGFVLIAWTLMARADALQVPAYDAAFFEQVVWNLGHGNGFTSGYFDASFLGLHFEPLLIVPALLERAWPDPRLLALLHAAALALSAPAAYLFLRAILGGARHAAFAAAALSAPLPLWASMQQVASAGFHTEVMALPLVLVAGWFGLRGRYRWCWILCLLALCAKEDQAWAVATMGLVLAFRGPDRRHGWALIALAMVWAGALELWAMPALLGGVRSDVASYYEWLRHPTAAAVAAHLLQPAGWLWAGAMVVSLAGLPLLRPAWLLPALPPLLGSLLSDHVGQPALQAQYSLPLMVPLLAAAGMGAERLLRDWEAPSGRALAAALCVPALVLGIVAGPLIGQRWAIDRPALSRVMGCASHLPPYAPLAADDDVAAPLAARPVERPLTWARPTDWVMVDTHATISSYVDPAARRAQLATLPGPGRRLVCDDGRFQLWTPRVRS